MNLDHLLHPRNSTFYSLGRTTTFRAASGAILDNWGTNLQNLEKSLRRLYWADKNRKLLQCDQSGAEALIVAYLAQYKKFRDLFLNNIKPHVYVALHMFKDKWKLKDPTLDIDGACLLAPKDLRSHPQFKAIDKLIKSSDNWSAAERYYYLAKQTCHSANYGIKAPTFIYNVLEKSEGKIALSRRDGEYFLSFYRTMFPEIPAWNEETRQQVDKTRTLYNLFGHPRYFTGVKNDKFFREAFAFVPQSTVGEITHKAFTRLQEYIEDNKLQWDILANTHDSYLVQAPDSEEEIKHCALKMTEFMNQSLISPNRITFQMKSEIAVGRNWSPKSSYNIEGLEEYKIVC